jgi:hypothetical protein
MEFNDFSKLEKDMSEDALSESNKKFDKMMFDYTFQEQKLEELSRDIDSGIEDLNTGRIVDGKTVMTRLKADYIPAFICNSRFHFFE